MATPAIHVQNLTKNYGPVLAVDDVTFQVQPGELVGFLGPNGAGKSTSMRILTTCLPASSGYAWLAGFDVMYQSMEVRQRIGYLPESVPLYPEMRVGEYLAYRAKLKGVERTAAPRGSTTASRSAASRRCRTGSSARSRRATASASAWPTPCSPTRPSSSSTSRPPASTRSRSARRSTPSANSAASTPSCSPRTSSPRSRRSASGSSSSTRAGSSSTTR